jgi:anti-sigma-K factor RskA
MAHAMSCAEAEELIALAVLGVLETSSSGDIDHHLSTCSHCRETARAYRRATSILPASLEPAKPSHDLRRRIMTEVYSSARTDRPHRLAPGALWRRVPQSRAFTVAAVATGVAAIVLGVWGATHTPGAAQTFAVAATTNQPGAHGQLTYFPNSARAVLTVAGIDASSGSNAVNVVEIWLVPRNGAPVPAAFLTPIPQTSTWTAVIAGDLLAYKMVAATTEPVGGRPSPTGPEIFSVALPQS